VAVHEVIRESRFGIAHGGEVLLPSIDTLDPGLSHEAFDALFAEVDALTQDELGVHTRDAIGAARLGVDLTDLLGQELVEHRAPGRALEAFPPVVIAARRDSERLAQHDDRVVGLVGSDRGAVHAFRHARFPGPSPEPDMRLSPHPALHEPPPVSRLALS
jgi:hypothetical protein